MNLDMIVEILSHSPTPVFKKYRLLNKECNKRTYDSFFLKLNLQRTNSVSGYFLQYQERLRVHSAFVKDYGNIPCGSKISLDFLPRGRVQIETCDASHGILLCVNHCPVRGRQPEYNVCKPTTKQYLAIPKPKTRYFTAALGLMVIGSDPFRYKIIRLSELPSREKRKYDFNFTLVCEVFDSDSFAWKRLEDVELPSEDLLISSSKPIASYGCLHWLTTSNNVCRFCLKTETWSFFSVPENLASDRSLTLAKYEGKLGVIINSSVSKDCQEIWVLESRIGNSWVNVKEIKNIGLEVEPVGFSSNDVVTLANVKQICLYNMDSGKSQNLQINAPNFSPSYHSTITYFPLRSDYERVDLNGRRSDGYQQQMKIECR